MGAARIAIIGVGPRGLTVLERIVAHERHRRSGELEVFLFDPQAPGPGCHDMEQSAFQLVNTVASQLTMFSDPSAVDAGPVMKGASFHEWIEEQTRLGTLEPPAEHGADAYLPRSLFGRYLHWVYRYVCAMAPPHVHILFRRAAVQRVHREGDLDWVVETADAKFLVQYLFLTTGHAKRAAPRRAVPGRAGVLVDDPYPTAERIAPLPDGGTVAVEGLGLAAIDVITELTVGRGGRFEAAGGDGELRYRPSGREPSIVAFSRSGLPLTARGRNQKGVSVQYKPRFLQLHTVRALRAARPLDFRRDVLPLLQADMAYAHYEALLRPRADAGAAFLERFARTRSAAERSALAQREIAPEDRFDWSRLADPVPAGALVDAAAWHRWLLDHLRADVREARRGNLASPLKAACEVIRDLRDVLRAAIDFGGLTEASHRWLLGEFVPLMNRLAVGPPESRIREWIALVEAGVLDIGLGPGARAETLTPSFAEPSAQAHAGSTRATPRHRVQAACWPARQRPADTLVHARVGWPGLGADAPPLLRGLLDDGLVRPFRNGGFEPGGIEVDAHLNWVDAHGRSVHNAWALGVPTEGTKFFTIVIPRTGVNSTALVDAGRCVSRLLATIAAREQVRSLLPAMPLPTEEEASAFASLPAAG